MSKKRVNGQKMRIVSNKKPLEGKYLNLGLQNLILIGVFFVLEKKETCTFERLIAECYQNFPKAFSFKRYPEWPDALKFDRPLRTLRERGLIVGTVKDVISLTEFGKEKAIKLAKILEKSTEKIQKNYLTSQTRSADDRLIEFVKSTSHFKDFLTNKENFDITEAEFRSLLRCTLETPVRILKQNLEYYLNTARSYNERKLIDFLLFCKGKFIKK